MNILEHLTPDVLERFWSKVEKADGCWLWKAGTTTSMKYGCLSILGISVPSHRISWIIANKKDVPKGLVILHECDVPACVNPQHLRLGTQSENIKDMWAKGRGKVIQNSKSELRCGSKSPVSKLTEKEVIRMREIHSQGIMNIEELAKLYAINQSTASRIINRHSWKHI